MNDRNESIAITDDLSEFDRFSETPIYRVSLKSNFEAAFWDASESFLFERAAYAFGAVTADVARYGESPG